MPNYKGHLVGGFFAYCLVFIFILRCTPSLATACEWLLFTLAGALFPDVDIKSKGQKYFYYVVFGIFMFLAFTKRFIHLSLLSFIAITPMLVKHRGIFHDVWFVIVMPLCIWLVMRVIFPWLCWPLLYNTLFFIAGALSHIILDRGIRDLFFAKRFKKRR